MLGSLDLDLGGLGAAAIGLAAYKVLSILSSFLVWGWFLYELGSVASDKTMILFYRKKLAFALLFLTTDYTMRQPWVLVPNWILDLTRIPLMILYSIIRIKRRSSL